MPKAFLVDTTRCTACRGCQLACKEWHDLPANETKQRGSHQNPPDLNPNNYKIVRFHEHLDKQGNVVWNFFPDQCRHCVTPICVDVADMAVPGAMIKDPKTGAVLVTDKIKKLSEQDMADVIHACPYNIPRYDLRQDLPHRGHGLWRTGRDPGPCQKAAGGRQKDSSQGIPGRS